MAKVPVRVVTHDIYKQETGRSFSGKPTGLGLHPFMRLNNLLTDPGNPIYAILLGVFTDTEPYILNGSTLENFKWNYQRLLYEKRIKGDATFAPWSMIGCRNNLSIVDDGKLWMAFCDSVRPLLYGQTRSWRWAANSIIRQHYWDTGSEHWPPRMSSTIAGATVSSFTK